MLPAAPERFSKPAKEMPATEPEPAPEIVQVESAVGPWSVSVPAPPLSATGTGKAPAETSKESSPAPPSTVRLVTEATGRLDATPSTVTTRLPPETATEIVCAASERATIHAAGGDGPLPGVAAGSVGGVVTPPGVVVPESPGAGVDAEPPDVPAWPFVVPEPEPAPAPEAVPATGDEPVVEDTDEPVDALLEEADVPEGCGAGAEPMVRPAVVPVDVGPGVLTCMEGEEGSGSVTVVSVGPSCGAGPELTVAPALGAIGPEPPELIVCCAAWLGRVARGAAAGRRSGVRHGLERPGGSALRRGSGRSCVGGRRGRRGSGRRRLRDSGSGGRAHAHGRADGVVDGGRLREQVRRRGGLRRGGRRGERVRVGHDRNPRLDVPLAEVKGRLCGGDGRGGVQLRNRELGEGDVGDTQRRERRDGGDRPGGPQRDRERTDVDRRQAGDARRSEPEPRTPLPQPDQAEGVGRSNVSRS